MGHKFYRDRQEKWDRRNLRTISTHLTAYQADALEICCHRMGTRPYRLIRNFLLDYIEECCNNWPEE